jgi:hypothetical protein
MTYLIIKEKTFINGDKFFTVHDHTDNKEVAVRKERGFNMAYENDKNTQFFISAVNKPLSYINTGNDPIVVKSDNNFNYNQLDLPFPEVAQ